MKLLILIFLVKIVLAQVGPIPDLPSEIVFAVTYRDFLPTTCSYTATVDDNLIATQQAAWDAVDTDQRPQRLQTCENYDVNIRGGDSDGVVAGNTLLRSGDIIGHPDFESIGQSVPVKICTEGQNFPVGSCAFILRDDGEFDINLNLSIVQQELEFGSNGLAKPVYCSDENGDETRCGIVTEKNSGLTIKNDEDEEIVVTGQTQTQKKFFDVWYNDDLRFNKRIGQNIVLVADANNSGSFTFDAETQIDDPDFGTDQVLGHFGPLGRFNVGPDALDIDAITDVIDAPAWPRTIDDDEVLTSGDENIRNIAGNAYYITTELHSTFEFRSNASMIFTFVGDDDFWAYINNKLVIDLGGRHSAFEATIDLNDANITIENQSLQEYLGLVDGETATLDIFHAERQTSESNFRVTSTLFPACNVLLSGTPTADFGTEVLNTLRLSNSAEFLADSSELVIQESGTPFSAGNFFTENQENVGRGFQATFEVKVSSLTEGFAFVVQAQGVNDLPVLSGSSFGITGLTQSFAVVFDLCANRDNITDPTNCALQTVSVHHPDNSTAENSFSVETRRTFDIIARDLARDEYFPVEVVHFGGKPNFLEVYVNGSLYLRENDFNLEEVLGGIGAHVGMTSSSSDISADITVRNFVLNTVEVNPLSSRLLVDSLNAPEEIVADGITTTEGVPIATTDACEVQLESGTLDDDFSAVFVEVFEAANDTARRLQEEPTLPRTVPAVIQDNGDGSYNIQLRTLFPGSYRLVIVFGDGCDAVQNNQTGEIELSLGEGVTETDCFFEANFNDGEVVAIAEPVDDSFSSDEAEDGGNNPFPILPVALISLCCFLCLLIVLIFYVRKKNRWEEEKEYVSPGELFKTEMETKFDPQNEYSNTGRAVLQTQQEILQLQTRQELNNRHKEIVDLEAENRQLKYELRKKRAVVGGEAEAEAARDELDEELLVSKKKAARKEGRTEF